MITAIFLYLVLAAIILITAPLRLLPDATLPADIATSISTISGYLTPLQVFLPVSTIFTILGLAVSIEAAILLWKGFNWLLRRLPTQS